MIFNFTSLSVRWSFDGFFPQTSGVYHFISASSREDSRGWFPIRRHARTSTESAFTTVASGVLHPIRADSSVRTVGSTVSVASGSVVVYTDVSIAAKPYTDGVAVRVASGTVQIVSDSRIEAISTSVSIQSSSVSALASTVIPIRGQRIRTSVGRVLVVIGPDLVQAEEDELIFLLEVA